MNEDAKRELIASLVAGWPALLAVDGACRFLGGDKPINPATLYRGVAAGVYPRPLDIGAGSGGGRNAKRFATLQLAECLVTRGNAVKVA